MTQTQDRQPLPGDRSAEPEPAKPVTAVLHTGGIQFASEKAVVEHALCCKAGVASVACNPVAQTSTVAFDPRRTDIRELRTCVESCGYKSVGELSSAASPRPMNNPG
jgi:Cu2+-exporting ATPase